MLILLISFVAGIDMFQEKVMGQGKQDNESAMEQAKDEKISVCRRLDSIRLVARC